MNEVKFTDFLRPLWKRRYLYMIINIIVVILAVAWWTNQGEITTMVINLPETVEVDEVRWIADDYNVKLHANKRKITLTGKNKANIDKFYSAIIELAKDVKNESLQKIETEIERLKFELKLKEKEKLGIEKDITNVDILAKKTRSNYGFIGPAVFIFVAQLVFLFFVYIFEYLSENWEEITGG